MRFDPQSNFVPPGGAEKFVRPSIQWGPLIGRWLINLCVGALCLAVPIAGYWVWNDYRKNPPGEMEIDGSALVPPVIDRETLTSDPLERFGVDHGQPAGIPTRLTPSQAACAKGQAYLDAGNAARAISKFEEALRINPDYAQARYGLALAHVLANDHAAARRERDILRGQDENLAGLLDNLVR